MNKFVFLLAAAMLIASPAHSQEAPVTDPPVIDEPTSSPTIPDQVENDQDQDGSDKDKKEHHKKNHPKKARKANFGALVSAEAHRLKAEGLNGKQKMGPWVSGQRRQNDSIKSASSTSKSDKNSTTSGGMPGQSGSHRK